MVGYRLTFFLLGFLFHEVIIIHNYQSYPSNLINQRANSLIKGSIKGNKFIIPMKVKLKDKSLLGENINRFIRKASNPESLRPMLKHSLNKPRE